jgi:hypothetical protein
MRPVSGGVYTPVVPDAGSTCVRVRHVGESMLGLHCICLLESYLSRGIIDEPIEYPLRQTVCILLIACRTT